MPNEWPIRYAARRSSARRIIEDLFADSPCAFDVSLPDGDVVSVGAMRPTFRLVLHSEATLRRLALLPSPLVLAEAYFSGDLDIEGDLYAALALRDTMSTVPLGRRATLLVDALRLMGAAGHGEAVRRAQARHAHNPVDNRRAIAFHYDVSNDFYRLWLDERMVYSCAYFPHEEADLHAAQRAKLEHICRKLRLKPGDRFLDVGCGWGALLLWAAQQHGVRATGITLSQRQFDYVQAAIRAAGLQDRVEVQLRDYREMPGEACFDKIASVGMFEHVGLGNLPVYFGVVRRLLKPGGLFLNHGITHEEEGWAKTLSTRFINRYVFPDGELDTVSNVMRAMEHAQMELWDVESLRPHYALTLRHWVGRLEARHTEALQHVSEQIYRIWRMYMAASALHFELGDVSVYQILASRRQACSRPLPLTRADLYA